MASLRFEIFHDQVLGVGSYGKVCKAEYGQLPCAAKLLHDTMFEGGDPGIFKFAERFEQECQFLSMIKHPNIVQYLGTIRNPQSQRLALLMELMDESLTRLLERSTGVLPYHIQINICHDVALALSYLHSNAIIHRDLSSNNVLLIGDGSRAKVTDFGMSKLMSMNPRMTPLTVCPGATVYMPPEALTTPPHYSSKLDCFSHGVLTIQILTRNFPKPGDAHRAVEDPNYPMGPVILPVPETERRKKDIDLIESNHPLLPLALHCLYNRATERPSADEVCERLATLKREERYTHCVEQTRDQVSLVQALRREIIQKDQIIWQERSDHETQLQLRVQQEASSHKMKDELICSQQAEITYKDKQISDLLKLITQKDQLLHEMDSQEQRNFFQDKDLSQNEDIRKKIAISSWEQGETTPAEFTSVRGTAITHGNYAYFSCNYDIFSFTVQENKWSKLPQCQYERFSMAIINDKLTTIGGRRDSALSETNFLLSLAGGQANSWREVLPPMPTERAEPAALATHAHLVVSGGYGGRFSGGDKVEVLDTTSLQWFTASSLPEVVAYPRLTLCGEYIYLSDRAALFSCSVEELLESCEPIPTSATLSNTVKPTTAASSRVWTRLADLPALYSASPVVVMGCVLAIGGEDCDRKRISDIHSYDRAKNFWSVIGQLPTQLSHSLVAVLPTNELIVVGGRTKGLGISCITNIAMATTVEQ